MKITGYTLDVIHWDYESEPLQGSKPEYFLDAIPITQTVTKDVSGAKLRWTYRLHKGDNTILSYIAEDPYTGDLANLPVCEMQKLINASYWRIKTEYERRLKEKGVESTMFLDFEPNLAQRILDHLKGKK